MRPRSACRCSAVAATALVTEYTLNNESPSTFRPVAGSASPPQVSMASLPSRYAHTWTPISRPASMAASIARFTTAFAAASSVMIRLSAFWSITLSRRGGSRGIPRVLQNQVGGARRDRHRRCIGVAGYGRGKHGKIDDPQRRRATHAQARIEHRGGVGPHAAGSHRMVAALPSLAEHIDDFI